jgi:hypothetical protein
MTVAWRAPPSARASEGEQPTEEAIAAGKSRAGLALLSGGLTALVPLAVGTTITARTDDRPWKRAGVDIGQFGFAMAPLVAHAIVGEWGRGAIFTSIPFATATALAIHQINHPVIVDQGIAAERLPFGIIYTATVAGSMVGLVDAMFAERRRASRPVVVPTVGMGAGDSVGISVGGVL